MESGGSVYIVTNKYNRVLYTGVTSELINRIYKHRVHYYKKSFSSKYNCEKLVYFEGFHTIQEAISREKQIKSWSRQKKIDLINSFNPEWSDLFNGLLET